MTQTLPMLHDVIRDISRIANDLHISPYDLTVKKYSGCNGLYDGRMLRRLGGFDKIKLGVENSLRFKKVVNTNLDLKLPREGLRSMVLLGDYHAPWHSVRGTKLATEFIGDTKPDVVIQMGDLLDQLSLSRYPRSHNIITPKDELVKGYQAAVDLWSGIKRASPKSECHQIEGNHDDRAIKRVMEELPAIEHLISPELKKLYTFDGVTTHYDSRDELIIDDWVILHGYLSFGKHAAYNHRNTATGHTHHGGLIILHNAMELNVGWLADKEAPVFGYHQQKKLHGTTLGLGAIDRYGPRFIPF